MNKLAEMINPGRFSMPVLLIILILITGCGKDDIYKDVAGTYRFTIVASSGMPFNKDTTINATGTITVFNSDELEINYCSPIYVTGISVVGEVQAKMASDGNCSLAYYRAHTSLTGSFRNGKEIDLIYSYYQYGPYYEEHIHGTKN